MLAGAATAAASGQPVRLAVCAANEIAAQGAAAILGSTPGVVLVAREVVLVGRESGWAAQLGAGGIDVAVLVSGVGAGHRWLLAVLSELVKADPAVAVLVVVDRARPGWLPELAEAGAAGIADLGTTADELRAALRAVASGQGWVSPEVAQVMAGQSGVGPGLSQRELDVLALLAQGLDNARAAAALGVSAHTVANHVKAICAKLGAGSRLEALTIAVRTGLVEIQ